MKRRGFMGGVMAAVVKSQTRPHQTGYQSQAKTTTKE